MIFINIYRENLDYDMKRILSNLGYRSLEVVPKKIRGVLDESLEEMQDILVADTVWDVFDFKTDDFNHRIIFQDDLFFDDEKVYNTLKSAEKIVVSIGTIGRKYDKVAQELKEKKELLKIVVYDAIGKSVIDNMNLNFRLKISGDAANENKGISGSFYPGSNGWDLKSQKVVFSILDGEKIDVELNENYIMIPSKSSSEVIGIGENFETKNYKNKCLLCSSENCLFRNTVDKC